MPTPMTDPREGCDGNAKMSSQLRSLPQHSIDSGATDQDPPLNTGGASCGIISPGALGGGETKSFSISARQLTLMNIKLPYLIVGPWGLVVRTSAPFSHSSTQFDKK